MSRNSGDTLRTPFGHSGPGARRAPETLRTLPRTPSFSGTHSRTLPGTLRARSLLWGVGCLKARSAAHTAKTREDPVRFGSVTVRGWNGSSGSGFRFQRFLYKKGFSFFLFQYSLTGKDGSGFGSWKTVPAVPVPLSVSGKTVPTVPVPGSGSVPEPPCKTLTREGSKGKQLYVSSRSWVCVQTVAVWILAAKLPNSGFAEKLPEERRKKSQRFRGASKVASFPRS